MPQDKKIIRIGYDALTETKEWETDRKTYLQDQLKSYLNDLRNDFAALGQYADFFEFTHVPENQANMTKAQLIEIFKTAHAANCDFLRKFAACIPNSHQAQEDMKDIKRWGKARSIPIQWPLRDIFLWSSAPHPEIFMKSLEVVMLMGDHRMDEGVANQNSSSHYIISCSKNTALVVFALTLNQ